MRTFPLLCSVMAAFMLGGCAVSRDVRLQDGWVAHVVSCGGPFLNLGHCLEKAGDICYGRGFDILNHEGGDLPKDARQIPTGGLPGIPQSREAWGQYPARQLFIKCH